MSEKQQKNKDDSKKKRQQVKQFTKGTYVETTTQFYLSYCHKKKTYRFPKKNNKSNNSQKDLNSKLIPNTTFPIVENYVPPKKKSKENQKKSKKIKKKSKKKQKK